MRGRPDDDLWGELYERFRRPGSPHRRSGQPRLSADARSRLFDAALGMLSSIRTVVDVAEEVLEERRARSASEPRARWESDDHVGPRPVPSAEQGVVRDIPFDGP